jgi:hypothetical protein
VNIDAPAVAEKPLQRGGAEDQQRVMDQRWIADFGAEGGIDTVLD